MKSKIGNYLGQLRLYSYADLILLFLWMDFSVQQISAATLFWFGFLIFLETQHRDRNRLEWPRLANVPLWLAAILVGQLYLQSIIFFLFVYLYTLKKSISGFGIISPIINGLVKGSLLFACGVENMGYLITVFSIMTLRNFLGDLRDIEKDTLDGARSFPMVLGLRNDIKYAYPLGLVCTTLLWAYLGSTAVYVVAVCLVAQLATYNLTPR